MKQMGLEFKFGEFKEGSKVKLTKEGIKGIKAYYNNCDGKYGKGWEDRIYTLHHVAPVNRYAYVLHINGKFFCNVWRKEIKYA